MFIRKAAALLIAAAISTSAGAFGLDSLTKIANSASKGFDGWSSQGCRGICCIISSGC